MKCRVLKSSETLDPVSGINFNRQSMLSPSPICHTHEFPEIFFIPSGGVWHIVNGRTFRIGRGDFTLIRPEDRHSYRRLKGHNCEFVNIAFPKEWISEIEILLKPEYSISKAMSRKFPATVSLSPAETAEFAAKLCAAYEVHAQDPKAAKLRFKLIVAEMLAAFKTEAGAEDGSVEEKKLLPAWIEQAVANMEKKENLRKGLPLLRRLACRSDEHISRSFRKFMDITPTDFVNRARVKYAASCLSSSDDKIDAISAESGFENLSHFYHVFKAFYGMSPRRYRIANRRSIIG